MPCTRCSEPRKCEDKCRLFGFEQPRKTPAAPDSIDRAMAYEAAEREKFEAWAKANTQLKVDRDIASYLSGTTQFAWMAWIERAVQADATDGVAIPLKGQTE